MLNNTVHDEFISDAARNRTYQREALALSASELILELMEKEQVNRAVLAQKAGTSKAHISQVLSGSRNMTVHTLADLAFLLGHRVGLTSIPLSRNLGDKHRERWCVVAQPIGLAEPLYHVHTESGDPVALNLRREVAQEIVEGHNG